MGVEWLNGRVCTRVYENYPENFTFEFGEATLAVDCLWRIIAGGKVVRTSRDHGQQFGLPAPVDAYAAAVSLLQGRSVVHVRLDESSADLILEFEGGQRLEVLTDSSAMSRGTSMRRAFTWLRLVAVVWPTSWLKPNYRLKLTAGAPCRRGSMRWRSPAAA